MSSTNELEAWLPWVHKARFVIISFVFAIEYATRQLSLKPPGEASIRDFGVAIIFWYVLGLVYVLYGQLIRTSLLEAYLEIAGDMVLITVIVHLTGDLESNYLSLYFVVIIMASILFPRRDAFLVAAVSFLCLGSLLEGAHIRNLYPALVERYPSLRLLEAGSANPVDSGTLEVKIMASLFGFFAVAYLASYLAERLRRARQMLEDKAGEVAGLHALNQDIICSMRGGLITADLAGDIREVNPAGAAILGYRIEELKGQPLRNILDAVPCSETAGPHAGYARREIAYRHPGGKQRILGVSASPLTVPETGVSGFIYTFQDLTDEKKLEAEYRAKDRMATIGHMAAGMAHEIRNPLASIAGSVKLLKGIASLNEDQARLMDIVSRESSRLDKLVSEFLVYSREQRFEFRPVNLVDLLEETLLLVEHHPLFGKRCRMEKKFPGFPVVASVDSDKMRQVFWNICDNSLKAMPKGGRLLAEIVDEPTEDVRVILGDTGIGFSASELERAFEPFHGDFPGGTGFGLAIVYQIIAAHEGRIQVKSRPGEGARFLIDLPRMQPGARQAEQALVPSSTSTGLERAVE